MSAPLLPGVPSHITYRPHIDGLRGISVLAVILYHAKFPGVTGGFVGVDVFFVISGFLIASIILRDLRAGSFLLARFWERRIRRIIPPLAIVMAFVLLVGYFAIRFPQDAHHLGNAVIAQSIFASNVLFTLTDNYFDETSHNSALLHTWTLSVEEQFYLGFPLLVLLLMVVWPRRPKYMLPRLSSEHMLFGTVLVLALMSFLLSVWFVNVSPSSGVQIPYVSQIVFWLTSFATAGFYMLPTRAWELALGVLLAFSAYKVRQKMFAEILTVLGLALIGAAIFLYTEHTPFPGLAALIPTFGALFVIAGNEQHTTYAGRLLSWKTLVGVGLISYSLYLWHWPLFVFLHVLTLYAPTPLHLLGAVGLSVALAALTYRFIEVPVRKGVFFSTRKSAYAYGVGSMVFLALLGFAFQQTSYERAAQVPEAARNIVFASDEREKRTERCFVSPYDTGEYAGVCRIGARAEKPAPDFLVWGDSHADAILPLLEKMAKERGLQGAVFVVGACAPVLGVHQSPPATGCEEEKARAVSYIEKYNVETIVLIARWTYYVEGGPDRARVAYITDSGELSTSPEAAARALARNFAPTVEKLTAGGRNVVVMKQVPEQLGFNAREAYYTLARSEEEIESVAVPTHLAYQKRSNDIIDALTHIPGVSVLDPTPFFCAEDVCPLQKGATFLYRDGNHVSIAGVMQMEPLFFGVFSRRP
jgi:peptidoglycan/LPS O-acetylase OafA/YrhL